MNELFTLNISYWILQTIAMLITALLIPGLKVSGPIPAFFTVLAIAFVNSKVWDAALFFQVPSGFTVQTGVLLLTNGVLFWIIVKFLPGIEVEGFMPAVAAPVIFTVTSLLISTYGQNIDWARVLDFIINLLEYLKEYLKEPAINVSSVGSG
ncbi:MAG: hypothetical protein D6719_06745 [Candidatus Dadabacteria bacterium]|nr:MAG: hypothetical protein D6719_06745 [Candidatus Dadabacteria bacterium]